MTCVSPGTPLPVIRVGDFILTHADKSLVDSMIRLGQRIRYRGDKRRFAYWNHAAGVVESGRSPVLVEMLAAGATVSPLSKYADREFTVVHVDQTIRRADEAAEYWKWLAETHVGYGYLSIVLDAIAILTRLPIGGAWRGRPVCSAAVAAGLAMNPWRASCAGIMPADLAYYFDAQ
jgi:hypothetical protein